MKGMERAMADIKTCIIHEGYTDEDCEYCTTELEQANQRYMRMLADAAEKEKIVVSLGQQVNPANWHALQLDMLKQVILRDPKQRMAFESEFARIMGETLENLIVQARRARITGGINFNNPKVMPQ
jgi:hypothetical protein